ncbi:MAG: DUF4846 domain-containing protein [Bacteroidota bacterium]
MRYTLLLILVVATQHNSYPWMDNYDPAFSISNCIESPPGFSRVQTKAGTFEHWLQNLPLMPEDSPVRTWDGGQKSNQNLHSAVVDLDFIGKNLQQCIDVIIRLRAEYLWSIGEADKVAFSYTCCKEKIAWSKWKNGWRTRIVKRNGRDAFEWIKEAEYDDSRKNFRKYLYDIMMYAGTWSLSENMYKSDPLEVKIGDAYIQGGAPGYGHGVLIVDMAESADGEKIMLLGQGFNPAENFNILKSVNDISPWFRVDFGERLDTPQWSFSKEHARKFQLN